MLIFILSRHRVLFSDFVVQTVILQVSEEYRETTRISENSKGRYNLGKRPHLLKALSKEFPGNIEDLRNVMSLFLILRFLKTERKNVLKTFLED